MRKYVTLVIGVITMAPLTRAADGIRSVYRDDLAGTVESRVASELDGLVAMYKNLHAHPELSRAENKAAKNVARHLKDAGYQVTTGVGGTGVGGLMDNGPGPTVLIRGDMDALPIGEETGPP